MGRRTDNRMSIRIIGIMSILLALLIVCTMRWKEQDSSVLGLDICTEEESGQRCSGRSFAENPGELAGLVLFNGVQVPYDTGSQCCYITQDLSGSAYSGTVTAADQETEIWLLQDNALQDKAAAAADAHRFTLYIARGDEYTVCGLIFTGLPVVSVSDDQSEVPDEGCSGALVTIFGTDTADGAVNAARVQQRVPSQHDRRSIVHAPFARKRIAQEGLPPQYGQKLGMADLRSLYIR